MRNSPMFVRGVGAVILHHKYPHIPPIHIYSPSQYTYFPCNRHLPPPRVLQIIWGFSRFVGIPACREPTWNTASRSLDMLPACREPTWNTASRSLDMLSACREPTLNTASQSLGILPACREPTWKTLSRSLCNVHCACKFHFECRIRTLHANNIQIPFGMPY